MVELKRKVSLKQKTTSEPEERQDVNLKRKVTLKTKQGTTIATDNQHQALSSSLSSSECGKKPVISKGKKAILGVVVLLLVGLGVYALVNRNGEKKSIMSDEPVAVVDDRTGESTGSEEENPGGANEPYAQETESTQTGDNGTQESEAVEETQPVVENQNASAPETPSTNEGVSDNISNSTDENKTGDKEHAATVASNSQTSSVAPISAMHIVSGIDEAEAAALWASLDQDAKDVILGTYGNGKEREENLGESYNEIQAKVNEYYRKKYGN